MSDELTEAIQHLKQLVAEVQKHDEEVVLLSDLVRFTNLRKWWLKNLKFPWESELRRELMANNLGLRTRVDHPVNTLQLTSLVVGSINNAAKNAHAEKAQLKVIMEKHDDLFKLICPKSPVLTKAIEIAASFLEVYALSEVEKELIITLDSEWVLLLADIGYIGFFLDKELVICDMGLSVVF
jgi:hypothetical protein